MRTILIPDNLVALGAKAGDFGLTPEAELAIVQLKEVEAELEVAMDVFKANIKQFIDLHPGLKSIKGSKVSVSSAEYGSKYGFASDSDSAEEFIKKETKITIDTDSVDTYLKEHNTLPDGIIRPQRNTTIKVSVKK